MSKGKYQELQERVRGVFLPQVEVWENKYRDKEYIVSFETKEFTCVCPKTGLPDFAQIFIEYSPEKYCLELKSFKEYSNVASVGTISLTFFKKNLFTY